MIIFPFFIPLFASSKLIFTFTRHYRAKMCDTVVCKYTYFFLCQGKLFEKPHKSICGKQKNRQSCLGEIFKGCILLIGRVQTQFAPAAQVPDFQAMRFVFWSMRTSPLLFLAAARQHGLYRQDYCGCVYSQRHEQ